MADPSPTTLGKCDEALPLLSITRQFDFGQFLMLRQKDEQSSGGVGDITASGQVRPPKDRPIVIDPSKGVVQAYQDWLARRQKAKLPPLGLPHGPGPVEDVLGGVSLTKLLKASDGTSGPAELKVKGDQLGPLLKDGTLKVGGKTYKIDVPPDTLVQIANGNAALVVARTGDGKECFVTELQPDIETKRLTNEELDGLLAKHEVKANGHVQDVDLDAPTAGALIGGQPALVFLNGKSNTVLRLVPPNADTAPIATTLRVDDVGQFLADPRIPAADGRMIPVSLEPDHVHELRKVGSTTVLIGKTPVTLHAGGQERSSTSYAATADSTAYIGAGGGSVHAATPVSPGNVAPPPPPPGYRPPPPPGVGSGGPPPPPPPGSSRPPGQPPPGVGTGTGTNGTAPVPTPTVRAAGLQVAVFMPWRQTWRLVGFSRGDLRHSLAMAPQEEVTIQVDSWQKRARTLDQSSSSEIEQSWETATTERETDDVFKELTTHHDFNWQIEGSVDATYNGGWGSVTVQAGGVVSDAQQLQQIARNTQQRVKESTQKSAAKVRTMRTTRITDAIETGSAERVTRKIKNANYSHTLTLDFFETLAHYEVTLEPIADRLGLVALIPNPLATKEFTPELVRRNESALRRALLDGALADGFDAFRRMRAYVLAQGLVATQQTDAKTTDEATDKSRKEPDTETTTKTPQEKAVLECMNEIRAAVVRTQDADIDTALVKINEDHPTNMPTAQDILSGQHWLFRKMCEKYLPSLLSAFDALPAAPSVSDAITLAALVPPPGSTTTLANLNDKDDRAKEDCGLGVEITRIVGGFAKWAWSSGRCKEENLYTPNDEGLAGLCTDLQKLVQEYRAKQAEGEAKEEVDLAITKANQEQDQLSTADKLEMAFPLDELSSASERAEALLAHLNQHPEHYSFALFQALSPAEQNMYIEQASGGDLEVGMFEPRVVALNGPDLAVPLSPPPKGDLRTMLENIRDSFAEAFKGTKDTPDTFVFPTPGLTINSRLGGCSACEEFIEDSRKIELRRLAAEADAVEQEVKRREARLEAGDLDDPDVVSAPLQVRVEQPA